ncbi:MAG TPA: DUF3055 domain-containing protein [Jeotgalicoccus sp.]|nr:DUF3055 domain-containing protein [Jeotgalicoccus sp.]
MKNVYLYDDEENGAVRFVGIAGDYGRYDLTVVHTTKFFGKTLVLNMQNNKFSIMGPDDLEEPGYVEFALGLTGDQALEVKDFLNQVLSPGWFSE